MNTIKGISNYEVLKNKQFVAGFATYDEAKQFVLQKDSSYKEFENISNDKYGITHEIHY